MKSDKARKYIEDWTFDATSLVDADGIGAIVLRRHEAVKAVELAEQEAEVRMRAELTRWRDPKEELPEEGVPVLVKFKCSMYAVLRRHENLYFESLWKPDDYGFFYADTSQFIGWRPIEE